MTADAEEGWVERVAGAAESAAAENIAATGEERRTLGRALADLASQLRGPQARGPEALQERVERIGQNEALFRHVNERLREGVGDAEDVLVVCECGHARCVDRIELTIADYERVRSDATWFVVRPGHELEEVEAVVERRNGWNVVQKDPGKPEQIATREDPRS